MPEMTPEERARHWYKQWRDVEENPHTDIVDTITRAIHGAEAPLRAEIERLREVISECRTRLGAYGLSVASCNLMRRIEFVMKEQPSDSALQERDSHKDQRIAALEAVIQGICYCGALDKTDPGKCDFCNVGTSTLEARDSRMKREGAAEIYRAIADSMSVQDGGGSKFEISFDDACFTFHIDEVAYAPNKTRRQLAYGRSVGEAFTKWLRDRAEKLEKPA